MGTTYAELKPQYEKLWSTAKLDAGIKPTVDKFVKIILANKAKYVAAVKGSLLPWWVVACLHYRESTLNFKTHLHNGDDLRFPTTHVPKGRPTPTGGPWTWEESAHDALKFDGLLSIANTSITYLLWRMELFNGKGYLLRQAVRGYSPYLWAFTNHDDERGKFESDGVYNPAAVEKQLGVVALMLGLQDAGVKLFETDVDKIGELVADAVGTVVKVGTPTAGATGLATGSVWIGIGVMVLVAIVVGAGVWYVLHRRSEKKGD